ncbi:MAG TPA: hypothetical protein VKQ11_03455 [Candidatus Sulfotelmatobacter sp.]|nr:hypothetical protein [Candidatus Sulfotelmatobacter sp.]
MKPLAITGILLIILGILSLTVPLPHQEKHGVSIGDAKISVQTENSERLPPIVGILLVGGGVLALVLGMRKA